MTHKEILKMLETIGELAWGTKPVLWTRKLGNSTSWLNKDCCYYGSYNTTSHIIIGKKTAPITEETTYFIRGMCVGKIKNTEICNLLGLFGNVNVKGEHGMWIYLDGKDLVGAGRRDNV